MTNSNKHKRCAVLSKDDFLAVIRTLKLNPAKSIRSISREMGLPRSAITRIVRGTHRYFERFRLELLELDNAFDKWFNSSLRYAETDEEIVKRVRYTRCPKCGAKVQEQIPCFACALREQQAQKLESYKRKLYDS